jgi:hypothetical protein
MIIIIIIITTTAATTTTITWWFTSAPPLIRILHISSCPPAAALAASQHANAKRHHKITKVQLDHYNTAITHARHGLQQLQNTNAPDTVRGG